MRISVIGLGYVGSVTAVCLAHLGHHIWGVDRIEEKVRRLNDGLAPVPERDLDQLLTEANARIRATGDVRAAVAATEISMICVDTPRRADGSADLSRVWQAVAEVAAAVNKDAHPHLVVIRSTVPPGTLKQLAAEFGGEGILWASNPEFLREGSAVADFIAPAFTLAGCADDAAQTALGEVYAAVDAPFLPVPPAVAELAKYAANAWHATKISFSNEIGRLARTLDVDGREIMRVLSSDFKLNCSPAYLRPGFAFGGPCLAKDLSALVTLAAKNAVEVPLLGALSVSNAHQIRRAVAAVRELGVRRAAILGLAFKAGTQDLRDSPAVTLAEELLDQGVDLALFAPEIYADGEIDFRDGFIRLHHPRLEPLLVPSAAAALDSAELAVVTHHDPVFNAALAAWPENLAVLDLAGMDENLTEGRPYYAIYW